MHVTYVIKFCCSANWEREFQDWTANIFQNLVHIRSTDPLIFNTIHTCYFHLIIHYIMSLKPIHISPMMKTITFVAFTIANIEIRPTNEKIDIDPDFLAVTLSY